MNNVDVESIIDQVRKKVENTKVENDRILDFIAYELSKNNVNVTEQILEDVSNYVDDKYRTRDEVKKILQSKFENLRINTINDVENQPIKLIDHPIEDLQLFKNMKVLFNKLEKNKDLSDLRDNVFHFGINHMSVVKRIFFLQITQNYLSALKYFIINDLVTKQTTFNLATEESIKNIVNMINGFIRDNAVSIQELKNYQRDSEKWLHANESKISELEERLKALDVQLPHTNESKIIELEERLKALDVQLPHTNESKIIEQEILLNELKNYQQDSEKWLHASESKISELEERFSAYESHIWFTKDEIVNGIKNLENNIKLNNRKFEEMQITLLYQSILNREPATWEYDCWISCVNEGIIHYNDLVNQIKNQEESKQLMKNYLVRKGISFIDNNTALKKINDHMIYFSANDHILMDIFSKKDEYEKTTVRIIKKLLKNGMNVINIGANVGYITLICAKQVGKNGIVFALEPYSKNVEFLRKNIAINGYTNVEIYPKAAYDKTGKAFLWIKPSGAWHFISAKKIKNLKKIETETITIDDLLKDKKMSPDLVIIDAEGSEKYILEGMKQTIKKNPNLEIIAEYNPSALEMTGTSGESFISLIREFKFSIFLIDESNDKVIPITEEELLHDFHSPKFANLFLTKQQRHIFS